MSESYIKVALSANPTLYLDVLEQCWDSVTTEIIDLEDGSLSYVINCQVLGKDFSITLEDMSKALGLHQESYDNLVNDGHLIEFFKFIRYSYTIKVGNLNRKFLKKQWSYVFATLLQVFSGRKSSFDQLSEPMQQIGYSLAYGKKVDVGKLIMHEICGKLGKNTTKRGNDILFPRFIQSVLNYLDANLTELPGLDKTRIGYSKSMSKVIFGNLDSRNDVNVRLVITHHMQEIFKSYPHKQPAFDSKYELARAKLEVHNANPGPTNQPPQPNTLPNTVPTASASQKVDASKKEKKRKQVAIEPLAILSEAALASELGCEEPESPLIRPKKKKKQTTSSVTQMAEVVKSGAHTFLDVSSQQGASIKTNILPNALSCKESVLGSDKADTTQSEEHIQVETPSISQGEFPKSILHQTTLQESNIQISLQPAPQDIEEQGFDHQ